MIDTAKPNGNCTSWETAVNWNAQRRLRRPRTDWSTRSDRPERDDRSEGSPGEGATGHEDRVVNGVRPVRGRSGIYHASGYLNGVDGGSSPEVTSITRQSVGIYLIHFSVDVSACGRVATLGIPSNQQNNAALFKGFPGEISTFFDLVSQSVVVATRDSSGTLADQDWQLLVAC